MAGFKVQTKQYSTCIYRKDSPLDLKRLEADIHAEIVRFLQVAERN